MAALETKSSSSMDRLAMDRLVSATYNCIDLCDMVKFQKTFTDLCAKGDQRVAADLAVRILKEQESAILQPNPKLDRYEFILINLKKAYPTLHTYFSRDPQPKTVRLHGLGEHAISSNGQRVIVSDLLERDVVAGKKIDVCDNFSMFEDKISNFILKSEENDELVFLVRHRKDEKDMTRHTSPVHIRKKNNNFQIFLTDSFGGHNTDTPGIAVAEMIDRIKGVLGKIEADHHFEINYYGGSARLGDGSNCIVLSIKDAMEMLRNTDTLYEHIESTRIPGVKDCFCVPILPLKFVKYTQSLTYIEKYMKDTNYQGEKIKSWYNTKEETLSDAIQRHTYVAIDAKTGQKKLRNGKIAKTFLKYERFIVAKCIMNGK